MGEISSGAMRLMIVDDNARVRRMIAEVAAPMTVDVVECPQGSQALAVYLQHRPDVVLMDVAMEGIDGIAATGLIRAVDPAARIVMVTDYDGVELREAAEAAGACGYVLKENLFELRALLERLGRADPG